MALAAWRSQRKVQMITNRMMNSKLLFWLSVTKDFTGYPMNYKDLLTFQSATTVQEKSLPLRVTNLSPFDLACQTIETEFPHSSTTTIPPSAILCRQLECPHAWTSLTVLPNFSQCDRSSSSATSSRGIFRSLPWWRQHRHDVGQKDLSSTFVPGGSSLCAVR